MEWVAARGWAHLYLLKLQPGGKKLPLSGIMYFSSYIQLSGLPLKKP